MTRRFHPPVLSFAAGVLDEKLRNREDIEAHASSAQLLDNYVVEVTGAANRRPGTRFVVEVKTSADEGRLLAFRVSTTANYILEMGDAYIRYCTAEGQLISGSAVEDVSPFLKAELFDIQTVQSADIMWMTQPLHELYELSRDSATAFTMAATAWTDGKAPMGPTNVDTAKTLTVVLDTGAVYDITAAGMDDFTSDDVGRAMRIKGGGNTGFFHIDSITSTTIVKATLVSGTAPTGGARTIWDLGMTSHTVGFRSIALYEGRLALGGTAFYPERVALSDSDIFRQFTGDGGDDEAIYLECNADQVSTIQWMKSTSKGLIVGTVGQEFIIKPTEGSILTSSSARVTRTTTTGSEHIQPVAINGRVVFVQENRRRLRRTGFDFVVDSDTAEDISVRSHDTLQSGVIEMAYQQSPDGVVWMPQADGTLTGVTLDDDQKMIAAHTHGIGGPGGSGAVESAAVIPNPDGTEDQLWLLVNRTIDGTTRRYIEFVENSWRPALNRRSNFEDKKEVMRDAFFLDCASEVNVPVTISGLTAADPGVVTATSHGFSNADEVLINDVVGMSEVNGNYYVVANKTTHTFELTDSEGNNVDTSAFTAYQSAGQVRKLFTSISGLTYLEGETLGVFADGTPLADVTVASGAVTLDQGVARAIVGFRTTCSIETQSPRGGSGLGSTIGNSTGINQAVISLNNSMGGEAGIGAAPTLWEPLDFDIDVEQDYNEPLPAFTGDQNVNLDGENMDAPTVHFRNTQPLPSVVISIVPRSYTGDR